MTYRESGRSHSHLRTSRRRNRILWHPPLVPPVSLKPERRDPVQQHGVVNEADNHPTIDTVTHTVAATIKPSRGDCPRMKDPTGTRRSLLGGLGAVTTALAGCLAGRNDTTDEGTVTDIDATVPPPTGARGVQYTFGRPTGNRYVTGTGTLPDSDPVSISLDATPRWLVATGVDDGSLWVVATANGDLQAFVVSTEGVAGTTVGVGSLPEAAPPVLDARGDRPEVLQPPDDAATTAHPTVVGDWICHVTKDGELRFRRDGASRRLSIDALPDGRIVTDGRRAAVPIDPTDRYRHGVLGDAIESTAIAVVDPEGDRGEPVVLDRTEPPGESVFEGLLPFWPGGEDRQFVLTEASASDGARVALYENGRRVAAGPRVSGTGGWTHQLAVGPFAPDGSTEIATVEKPHVEHNLQFLARDGDSLSVEAARRGYQSHTIAAGRNTSRVRAGDFDADGRPEVLLPRTDQQHLDGVRHTPDGAERVWTLDLGARVASNLATADRNGRIAVGVGLDNGRVNVWPADG